jgi:hypothetical protein
MNARQFFCNAVGSAGAIREIDCSLGGHGLKVRLVTCEVNIFTWIG